MKRSSLGAMGLSLSLGFLGDAARFVGSQELRKWLRQ